MFSRKILGGAVLEISNNKMDLMFLEKYEASIFPDLRTQNVWYVHGKKMSLLLVPNRAHRHYLGTSIMEAHLCLRHPKTASTKRGGRRRSKSYDALR